MKNISRLAIIFTLLAIFSISAATALTCCCAGSVPYDDCVESTSCAAGYPNEVTDSGDVEVGQCPNLLGDPDTCCCKDDGSNPFGDCEERASCGDDYTEQAASIDDIASGQCENIFPPLPPELSCCCLPVVAGSSYEDCLYDTPDNCAPSGHDVVVTQIDARDVDSAVREGVCSAVFPPEYINGPYVEIGDVTLQILYEDADSQAASDFTDNILTVTEGEKVLIVDFTTITGSSIEFLNPDYGFGKVLVKSEQSGSSIGPKIDFCRGDTLACLTVVSVHSISDDKTTISFQKQDPETDDSIVYLTLHTRDDPFLDVITNKRADLIIENDGIMVKSLTDGGTKVAVDSILASDNAELSHKRELNLLEVFGPVFELFSTRGVLTLQEFDGYEVDANAERYFETTGELEEVELESSDEQWMERHVPSGSGPGVGGCGKITFDDRSSSVGPNTLEYTCYPAADGGNFGDPGEGLTETTVTFPDSTETLVKQVGFDSCFEADMIDLPDVCHKDDGTLKEDITCMAQEIDGVEYAILAKCEPSLTETKAHYMVCGSLSECGGDPANCCESGNDGGLTWYACAGGASCGSGGSGTGCSKTGFMVCPAGAGIGNTGIAEVKGFVGNPGGWVMGVSLGNNVAEMADFVSQTESLGMTPVVRMLGPQWDNNDALATPDALASQAMDIKSQSGASELLVQIWNEPNILYDSSVKYDGTTFFESAQAYADFVKAFRAAVPDPNIKIITAAVSPGPAQSIGSVDRADAEEYVRTLIADTDFLDAIDYWAHNAYSAGDVFWGDEPCSEGEDVVLTEYSGERLCLQGLLGYRWSLNLMQQEHGFTKPVFISEFGYEVDHPSLVEWMQEVIAYYQDDDNIIGSVIFVLDCGPEWESHTWSGTDAFDELSEAQCNSLTADLELEVACDDDKDTFSLTSVHDAVTISSLTKNEGNEECRWESVHRMLTCEEMDEIGEGIIAVRAYNDELTPMSGCVDVKFYDQIETTGTFSEGYPICKADDETEETLGAGYAIFDYSSIAGEEDVTLYMHNPGTDYDYKKYDEFTFDLGLLAGSKIDCDGVEKLPSFSVRFYQICDGGETG